jgi:hypothetical protein
MIPGMRNLGQRLVRGVFLLKRPCRRCGKKGSSIARSKHADGNRSLLPLHGLRKPHGSRSPAPQRDAELDCGSPRRGWLWLPTLGGKITSTQRLSYGDRPTAGGDFVECYSMSLRGDIIKASVGSFGEVFLLPFQSVKQFVCWH